MESKIQALGRIKKEFPPRGNLQIFQLESPATFTCAVRKLEVTSAKVALDLRTANYSRMAPTVNSSLASDLGYRRTYVSAIWRMS